MYFSRVSRRVGFAAACLLGGLAYLSTAAQAHPYTDPGRSSPPPQVTRSSHDCNAPSNVIANCGFETGDLTGWVSTDLTFPLYPIGASATGFDPTYGFFLVAPTEGGFAATNGFDGNGPGTIELAQDVTLPPDVSMLEFDYRLAWDYSQGIPATQDRVFSVQIQPTGGGAPLLNADIFTAPVSTPINLDTGNLSGTVDLSGFAGQSVRINFVWWVPEDYSGPAFFQLDNVATQLRAVQARPVPVDSPLMLLLLSLTLGGIAMRYFRRS